MSAIQLAPRDLEKKALSVARQYGFLPFDEARRREPDPVPPEQARAATPAAERVPKGASVHERILGKSLELCAGSQLLPRREPILFYTTSVERNKARDTSKIHLGLHLLGSKQPIAEVLVLKAAASILESTGTTGATLRLNSIGDRDSVQRYTREVHTILRRHAQTLPDKAAALAREDLVAAIGLLRKHEHEAYDELPRSIDHLTSPSRRHLKEVLEFIEHIELDYELDSSVLRNSNCFSNTVFEVSSDGDDGEVLHVLGGRYDELSRAMFRSNTPAVGAVLTFDTPKAITDDMITQKCRFERPRVCFIHVGTEARKRSFSVIDTFRRARIPVEQCFKYERLTDQLAYAEQIAAPYMVIMGQKEAREGVVILRRTDTRAQRTVPIEQLAAALS